MLLLLWSWLPVQLHSRYLNCAAPLSSPDLHGCFASKWRNSARKRLRWKACPRRWVSTSKVGWIWTAAKLRDLSYQWVMILESYQVSSWMPRRSQFGVPDFVCVSVFFVSITHLLAFFLRVRFVPKISSCRLDSWRACFAAPWFGQGTRITKHDIRQNKFASQS